MPGDKCSILASRSSGLLTVRFHTARVQQIHACARCKVRPSGLASHLWPLIRASCKSVNPLCLSFLFINGVVMIVAASENGIRAA